MCNSTLIDDRTHPPKKKKMPQNSFGTNNPSFKNDFIFQDIDFN